MEYVILVDKDDNPVGIEEKMKAHEKALLHRAFSVFIYNEEKEILLHRRALSKYHSGGLWTNACCSHPKDGESIVEAGHRRLMEEMGFDTELEEIFTFVYRAELDHNLTEYEYDHVFLGKYQGDIDFNLEEVMEYKWINYRDLALDIKEKPHLYTEWFKIIMENLERMGFEKKLVEVK